MTDSWTQDPQVRDDPALREYLDALASTAREPVDPAVRTATLQAMLTEAARQHRRAPAPAPSWRRRARRVLAITGVKVVLASSMAVAATGGGLAATGTLPDPVQEFVHEVGTRVGLPIPAPPGSREGRAGPTHRHATGWTEHEHQSTAPTRGTVVPDPGRQDRAEPSTDGREDESAGDVPGPADAPDQLPTVPSGKADPPDTPAGLPEDGPVDQVPVPPAEQVPDGPGDQPDRTDGTGRAGHPPGSGGRPPDSDTGPPDQASTGAPDSPPDSADAPGRSGSPPGQPTTRPGQRGGPADRG